MKEKNKVLEDYRNALYSLKNGILEATTDLEIDGVIQRFEFTFELFWKLLKLKLEEEGIFANSPRSVFKEIFAIQFITNEEILLNMLYDRNETTHLYNKQKSRVILERIKNQYLEIFFAVLNKIEHESELNN
ncbi:MAG TPA: HI0074 family nucleotidyltransferase substrate-binding subunit [bacterium]|nr:HI0074 family nucleotidyltransferase substrate-binding subunit [bacterium]HOL47930.1 HI0074 family nucleotidyltransferase substrate-binding subunit [bacterium]HPQ20100.1 HI0074 family nucleotidyltransferase substrate-binding subunit [bacterium]